MEKNEPKGAESLALEKPKEKRYREILEQAIRVCASYKLQDTHRIIQCCLQSSVHVL